MISSFAWAENEHEVSDLEHSMLFHHYRSALKEGYSLYSKVTDEKSKKIIGCSIKNNIIGLKAFVDLDLPNLIKNEELLLYMTTAAQEEWDSLRDHGELYKLKCYPLDPYWDTLVK